MQRNIEEWYSSFGKPWL